ncbi:unnamed protein product [Linum trigynum]
MPPTGVPTKRVWRLKKLQIAPLQEVISLEKDVVSVQTASGGGGGGGVSEKGKEVVVDSTPPVTPSALPSQEEFNKVINGAKSKSVPRKSATILHSNAFDLLYGRDIKLQAPQKKQGGREGLRSKGATKVATPHR